MIFTISIEDFGTIISMHSVFFKICIGIENIFKALNAFSLKGHIGPHFRAQTPKPGSMNFIIHEEGFMYIMFMHTDFLTIVGVKKIFKD